MNIVDLILPPVLERPDHPAIEDGERVISYSTLSAMVNHAAAQLRSRGVQTGDIIAVSLPDMAEHVAILLALAKVGAVSFSLDPRAPEAENRRTVLGFDIRCAVVAKDSNRFLEIETLPIGALCGAGIGAKREAFGPQTPDAFDPDSPLMLIQSSGTTGEPKRLFVTHGQMAGFCQRLVTILGLTSADRYLQVPYLRFYSGRRRCFTMLMLGATVVLNRADSIAEYSRYFSGHSITYVHLTPFHLRALLASVKSGAPLWPQLKIVVGAAPITPNERLLARQRLTPHVFESLGTNEVSDLALAAPTDQDLYPASVGRLIPGIEAQVVGNDGSTLPFGEIGDIGFRGPQFPHEYHENPEATARHFRDDWFYPGDLASINQDGYVFLKGRTDDVINNAGVKYFPAEVEGVLLTHPSVVDVAVIGGPHAQFGEVSVAYVVRSADLTPNELYKFCQGKIALYKAPHWVFFLHELPRVPIGKPDRKALREMFRRYLETRPQEG